jgi:hypothetical protein
MSKEVEEPTEPVDAHPEGFSTSNHNESSATKHAEIDPEDILPSLY